MLLQRISSSYRQFLLSIVCFLVVAPALGQSVTVPLQSATAVTGVLSGTSLVLVSRTVPAGYMQLFPAYDGSYRKPVVIIEGFDPLNRTIPADFYATLNTSGGLDMLRAAGRSVWIVNFGDGGGALTANAKLVSEAIDVAANYGGLTNAGVDVFGVSMGGVIGRYALAYDEQFAGPSDGLVRLFVSGDSPQQGANGPPSIQEIAILSNDPTYTPLLNCDAALSLLYTSVRSYNDNGCLVGELPSSTSWTGSTAAHDWFYNTLNALNGDGYPHKCRGAAVANGSMSPQPHGVGETIYSARTFTDTIFGEITWCREDYGAYPMDVAPGSLGADFAPGSTKTDNFELTERFIATFIPTESALDIRGGVSKFDRTVYQTQAVNHSTITTITTDFLLEEVLGPERRYNPKYLPDNSNASIYDWIVTAVFPGQFYIESPDRVSGLLVVSSESVQEGKSVTVRGQMTSVGGERRINAASVTIAGPADVPRPLGLPNWAIGGGPMGPFTAGMTGGTGLNNTGLLITTWGKVSHAETGFFYIDDGSELDDGSGFAGVKVSAPGLSLPAEGDIVVATGISSCYQSGTNIHRLLLPQRQSDIRNGF